MNQNHIGVDIIEIARIKQALDRWDIRFLTRIFSDTEIKLYGKQPKSLAARFAGKEAVIKALSPAEGTIAWKDVEILSEPNGKPLVELKGRARNLTFEMGLSGFEISLSHSREYAIAFVIGFKEG